MELSIITSAKKNKGFWKLSFQSSGLRYDLGSERSYLGEVIRYFGVVLVFICIFALLPTVTSAAVLNKPANNLGLVGYWNFNEGTSTIATDFSGRGNFATTVNMALPPTSTSGWGTGKRGGGLNFDGTNDYVSIANEQNFDFDQTNAFSISSWVYRNAATDEDAIFEKVVQTGGLYTGYALFVVQPAGDPQCLAGNCLKFAIVIADGSAIVATSSAGALTTGRWNHVAITYSGSANRTGMKIYLNGVDRTTESYSDVLPGGSMLNNAPLYIGVDRPDDPCCFFNGKIDEVRVYSRALSAGEAATLYKTGASKLNTSQNKRLTSGLVGMWDFSGANTDWRTNKTNDFSGNGNTGVMTNMSTSTTPGIGKLGQALNFDGVNDYVNSDPIANDVQSGSYSVSFWFKLRNNFNSTTPVGQTLLHVADPSSNNDIYFLLDVCGLCISGVPGKLGFGTGNGGGGHNSVGSISASWTRETWYHVVGTFSTVSGTVLYIDGVENATNPATTRGSTASLKASIGANSDTPSLFFDGSIDEVRVYNRAITATETKQLYLLGGAKVNTSQNNRSTSGLMGLWSFNGPDINWTTNKALDRGGQGNDGVFTNMATRTAPVIGKVGQALQFGYNSTHDVRFASAGASLGATKTICAWIKPRSYGLSASDSTIMTRDDGVDAVWSLQLADDDSGIQTYYFSQTFTVLKGIWRAQAGAITLNVWQHACMTYDGSSTTNVPVVYINATPQTVTTFSIPSGTRNDEGGASIQHIGNYSDAFPNSSFDGALDEVRIYNRILTSAEVKRLYLMGR